MKTLLLTMLSMIAGAMIAANLIASNELELREQYTQAVLVKHTLVFKAQLLKCTFTSTPDQKTIELADQVLKEAQAELDAKPGTFSAWRLWRLHKIERSAAEAAASLQC